MQPNSLMYDQFRSYMRLWDIMPSLIQKAELIAFCIKLDMISLWPPVLITVNTLDSWGLSSDWATKASKVRILLSSRNLSSQCNMVSYSFANLSSLMKNVVKSWWSSFDRNKTVKASNHIWMYWLRLVRESNALANLIRVSKDKRRLGVTLCWYMSFFNSSRSFSDRRCRSQDRSLVIDANLTCAWPAI